MLVRLRWPMPMPATAILSEGGVAPPSPSVDAETTSGAVAILEKSRRVGCRVIAMATISVPAVVSYCQPVEVSR